MGSASQSGGKPALAAMLPWSLASLACSVLLAVGLFGLAACMSPSGGDPVTGHAEATRGIASLDAAQMGRASAGSADRLQGQGNPLETNAGQIIDRHLAEAGPGAVVVGIIADGRVSIIGRGDPGRPDAGPADGRTVFQIASLTKPLTGTVMARMMLRGEVAPGDPIYRRLDVIGPMQGPEPVRLIDLATHTSGLPSVPETGRFSWSRLDDPRNPYKPLSRSDVRQWLAGYRPVTAPGTHFVYSNVGMALLGEALAQAAGLDYATLLEREITAPLAMNDTGLRLSKDQSARKATGHAGGQPVPDWEAPAMAPSFGVYSTVDDMLRWLGGNLGHCAAGRCPPDLKRAMALAQTPIHYGKSLADAGALGQGAMALGWFVANAGDGTPILWHSGSTGGFNSYMALSPDHGWAVVALAATDPKKLVADRVVMDLVGQLQHQPPRLRARPVS